MSYDSSFEIVDYKLISICIIVLLRRFETEGIYGSVHSIMVFITYTPSESLILCNILETPKHVLRQTVKALMKCRKMRHFMKVYIVVEHRNNLQGLKFVLI